MIMMILMTYSYRGLAHCAIFCAQLVHIHFSRFLHEHVFPLISVSMDFRRLSAIKFEHLHGKFHDLEPGKRHLCLRARVFPNYNNMIRII